MIVIYTGCIDEFYDYKFGKLPYRSLCFEHQHLNTEQYQSVGTINYPTNDFGLPALLNLNTLQVNNTATSIVREYPTAEGDPYYPIPRDENEALFKSINP